MIMAALALTVSPLAPPASPMEVVPEPWATLADCESGDWVDGGADFMAGSARWDWGAPDAVLPPWGTDLHEGGLQWNPDTWDWLRPDHFPEHAYDASPPEEIAVARRLVAFEQSQGRGGFAPWPVCSQKIGLPR